MSLKKGKSYTSNEYQKIVVTQTQRVKHLPKGG